MADFAGVAGDEAKRDVDFLGASNLKALLSLGFVLSVPKENPNPVFSAIFSSSGLLAIASETILLTSSDDFLGVVSAAGKEKMDDFEGAVAGAEGVKPPVAGAALEVEGALGREKLPAEGAFGNVNPVALGGSGAAVVSILSLLVASGFHPALVSIPVRCSSYCTSNLGSTVVRSMNWSFSMVVEKKVRKDWLRPRSEV